MISTRRTSLVYLLMTIGCCALGLGCRAPWQINSPRYLGADRLVEEEAHDSYGDEYGEEEFLDESPRRRSRPGTQLSKGRTTSRSSRMQSTPKSTRGRIETEMLDPEFFEEDEALGAYQDLEGTDSESRSSAQERIAQEIQRRERARESYEDRYDYEEKSVDSELRDEDAGDEIRMSFSDRAPTGKSTKDVVQSERNQVRGVSYEEPESAAALPPKDSPSRGDGIAMHIGDIDDLGDALLKKLDQAESSTTQPQVKVDLQKKKRLLNLAFGDLQAAQQPIEGIAPEAQEYISHTLRGLDAATHVNGNPESKERLADALQSHRHAERSLEAVANLEIHNLAFCTEIDGFGEVKRFPAYEFQPDQQVLLYCELENFVSEKVPQGFRTRLQGSYEILDERGNRIMEQTLPEDTDVCAQQRRDFYIAYRFHLPKRIDAGTYQLRLVLEDMQGHKFGQATVDFDIEN